MITVTLFHPTMEDRKLTLELPRETPGAITVFILLQGVLYGFGLWWVMYLYVWYLLALLILMIVMHEQLIRKTACK